MGKYTIYLRKEYEDRLKRVAESSGMPLHTLLGRRVVATLDEASHEKKIADISAHIERLADSVEAMLSLLEFVAVDAAQVAGVTRASTQSNAALVQAGTVREQTVKRAIEALREATRSDSH